MPPKKKFKPGNRNPKAQPGKARGHLEICFFLPPESEMDMSCTYILHVEKVRLKLRDFSKNDQIKDILEGRVVGKRARRMWFEEQKLEVYNAKFEKLKKNKVYKVAYWLQSESYDDSTDYDMSMYQLAADLLYGDLLVKR